ncbi:MAG TPA: cytochrome c biogenesis protein CcsA [Actinomycetota bacterium]|nr:cytochrome c biogenesis protein CcsA [Actinomycetota bacterium]
MRIARFAATVERPRGRRALAVATGLTSGASLVVSLLAVPPDAEQGDVQRLMYVHVPAAWLAYLAFTVVFLASLAFLRTGRSRWDRVAHASAEIGVVFTALAIVLGSLWGRPVWGVWWTWDPRLTTTAVLLLIYVGYLAVRRLADDPIQRGRWAAVVGVIGFLDVPVVHLSVVWWRSLHQGPSVLRIDGPVVAPPMLAALLLGVAAFTFLYAYLMVLRLEVERLEANVTTEALSGRLRMAADPAIGVPGG